MSDAQTEARAIAERLMLPDEDVFNLAVDIIAAALAAKDAELERRDMQLEASAKVALDLSAQLAEARKALEAIEIRTTQHPCDNARDDRRDKALANQIARRAREQGGQNV